MMAYGRIFDREGTQAGLRRIALRCLRIYAAQVGLLLATLLIIKTWTEHFRLIPLGVESILEGGLSGVMHAVTLQVLPPNLDILPLYIVLLLMFPPFYLMLRVRPALAIGLSAALWLLTQFIPGLNFTNGLNGLYWFFNPFAWQFLFVIGAMMARYLAANGGVLPRDSRLVALAIACLAVGFVVAAPWRDWGLPGLARFTIPPLDKTNLSFLRLLHVVALTYVVLTWRSFGAIRHWAPVRALEACGRHSLQVFSLGTILVQLGQLVFRTYGMATPMQVLVNSVGLSALVLLGLVLDRDARTSRAPKTSLGPSAPWVQQ
jgi:hypothetical protein